VARAHRASAQHLKHSLTAVETRRTVSHHRNAPRPSIRHLISSLQHHQALEAQQDWPPTLPRGGQPLVLIPSILTLHFVRRIDRTSTVLFAIPHGSPLHCGWVARLRATNTAHNNKREWTPTDRCRLFFLFSSTARNSTLSVRKHICFGSCCCCYWPCRPKNQAHAWQFTTYYNLLLCIMTTALTSIIRFHCFHVCICCGTFFVNSWRNCRTLYTEYI
jgi:hypothetical protein